MLGYAWLPFAQSQFQAVDTAQCEFKFEEPDFEGLTKFLVEDSQILLILAKSCQVASCRISCSAFPNSQRGRDAGCIFFWFLGYETALD